MNQKALNYRNSTINYYCFGKGLQPVFCLHGYGEDGRSFLFLEKYADLDFTFYAIDLPFHGLTEWKEDLDFTHEALVDIITAIIPSQPQDSPGLILLGFSLGGRISLSLYESQPSSTAGLLLLAPDGLRLNPWYWLATQTWAGNRLFSFTMKHPKWFFVMLKGLNKIGTVNSSIFKFVNYYIGDSRVRQQLYTRWTALRKFKPDLSVIKKNIGKYRTPVQIIYGKHDRIILPVRGQSFIKGVEQFSSITILETGHQVLQERQAATIVKGLNSIREKNR